MAWNKDKPGGSDKLQDSDDDLRDNFAALETQLGHGHNFPTDGGHKKGSAVCYYQTSAPTTKQDGATALDADDNGSLWIDSDASPKILYYYVHGTGWVAAGTIMSLLDEDDMASDDDTLAPTQQSTKAYADARETAAKAACIIKDGSTAFTGTGDGFKDEDDMASDSATAIASQQSIKKYVDDQISALDTADGDAPTLLDSESNAMVKDHAYKAQTAGFASAILSSAGANVFGYVGATSDPAGAGTKMVAGGDPSYGEQGGQMFVPKDYYFEFTSTGTLSHISWTPLVSGGGAPVDQD